jgi:hypothetical protein
MLTVKRRGAAVLRWDGFAALCCSTVEACVEA